MTLEDFQLNELRHDLPCPTCGETLKFSVTTFLYACSSCKETFPVEEIDPLPVTNFRARKARYSHTMLSSSPEAYFRTWFPVFQLACDAIACLGEEPIELKEQYEKDQLATIQRCVRDIMWLGKTVDSLRVDLTKTVDLLVTAYSLVPSEKREEWKETVVSSSPSLADLFLSRLEEVENASTDKK